MGKKKKIKENKDKLVKSINNNVRSSTRKLNPILKAIVGKKEPYEYLTKSISEFVNQDELIELMKKSNFENCNYFRFMDDLSED